MQIPSIKIRLEVYKKSLEFLKNETYSDIDSEHKTYRITNETGLCCVLPVIWLNCSLCSKWKDKEGNEFNFPNTPKYFPEFKKYYPNKNYIATKEYRISILQQIIKDIENGTLNNK